MSCVLYEPRIADLIFRGGALSVGVNYGFENARYYEIVCNGDKWAAVGII